MPEDEPIVCKIAPWFYRRMAMIFAMLVAFGAWFFYDGKFAWPKKNRLALAQEAFEAAAKGSSWEEFAKGKHFSDAGLDDETEIALIREAHAEGGKPMPWDEFKESNDAAEYIEAEGEEAVRQAFSAGVGADSEGEGWERYAASLGGGWRCREGAPGHSQERVRCGSEAARVGALRPDDRTQGVG